MKARYLFLDDYMADLSVHVPSVMGREADVG